MKTNQILIRDDNRFVQRTKDGYFNANSLLDSFNKGKKKKKQLGSFKVNDSYDDFINQLKKEGIENPIISSRGKGGGTWMHPKLFIDFAMWLSVEFKSKVIDYVLDGLIKSRHEAGDYYNEMCATIMEVYIDYYGKKPPSTIFINEARLVKSCLGVENMDRNEMTEHQLNNVTILQKLNAKLMKDRVGKESRVRQLKQLASALS